MSVQPRISNKVVVGSRPRDPKLPSIVPTPNGVKLQPISIEPDPLNKSGDQSQDRLQSPSTKDWNTSVAVPFRKGARQAKAEDEEVARVKKLTLQKAEALVASREEKLKLKETQPPIKSPKTPSEKKPVSTTRIKIYEHSGKWVFNVFALQVTMKEFSRVEQKDAWSCCLNTKKESQGCSFTSYDPMKIDYDAI